MSVRRQAWQAQMSALFNAYMKYKYGPEDLELLQDGQVFNIAVLGVEGKYLY